MRSARVHAVGLILSFLLAQAIMLTVLWGPLWDRGWWSGFRGYFDNDQLSYAAIAVTVSQGTFTPVEPLTETGVSFYPSGWYQLIGLVSFVTGLPVYRLWTILGLLAVSLTVGGLGWLAYRVSGRAWAPLLPGLALLTGTLSMLTTGWWYTSLSNHAVVWGPYGTLFTLNAEAIGLMVVTLEMSMLLVAAISAQRRPRRAAMLVIFSAILVGVLANVQTYAFFTGVSLSMLFLATWSLLRHPSTARLIATSVWLAAVIASGPWIASSLGPLPLFGLVMTAVLPAAWPVIREHIGSSVIALAAFGLAAAPQVIRTVMGLAAGDEFLTYRQASTQDLGVPVADGLIAVVPLLAIAAFILAVLVRAPLTPERTAFGAVLVALGAGLVLMGSNDRWGFDQEPYRFWLQYSIIGILLCSVIVGWAVNQQRVLVRTWRAVTAVTGIMALLVWIAALSDVRAFWQFARESSVIPLQDSKSLALASALPADARLVVSSACFDPQVLRLATGRPVAFFNRGLAWPEKRGEIDQLLDPGRVAASDPAALAAAGVSHVVTDTQCEGEWAFSDGRVQPERIAPYDDGVITVWRVASP